MILDKMPSGVPTTSTEFSEDSDCLENLEVKNGPGSSLFVSIDYIKSAGAADSSLDINYKWSTISTFCMKFPLNLVTLVNSKLLNNGSSFELTFINLKDPSTVSLTQLNISDSRVTATDKREDNGKLVVTVDCD